MPKSRALTSVPLILRVPMRRVTCQAARLLLLAGYMLATAAGGLFHVHGSRHVDCASGETANSCRHSACDERSPTSSHPDRVYVPCGQLQGPGGLLHGDEESCPVCQFLAQKPIPGSRAELTAVAPADREAAFVMPVRAARGVSIAFRSRAPPAVA